MLNNQRKPKPYLWITYYLLDQFSLLLVLITMLLIKQKIFLMLIKILQSTWFMFSFICFLRNIWGLHWPLKVIKFWVYCSKIIPICSQCVPLVSLWENILIHLTGSKLAIYPETIKKLVCISVKIMLQPVVALVQVQVSLSSATHHCHCLIWLF